ncbi:MAG: radical SAM protein [Clostridiales bacterium]|nr:radical SAM protein [Clostridiales bacterium]
MSKSNYIVPIFVPHKGCPYNCIFCNQKRITGQAKDLTTNDIDKMIGEYIKTIKKRDANIEVAFFGGSFTAIPMEEQNKYLKIANKYLMNGDINAIRLSTRPDFINKEIVSNLKRHGVTIVELGVQTMDEDVLLKSGRGHLISDTEKAIELLKEEGFIVGVQLMVGLPGDSKEKCLDTARKVVRQKPDFSRIYPSLVIKDTYMEQMYNNGDYKPFEIKEAVDICKEMLIILESNSINVIRIGLQPTEEMQMGKSVVAGPYHPSFRQLVESEIFKDMIDTVLSFLNMESIKDVTVCFNTFDYSNVIGQKKTNIKFFNDKYPDTNFIFCTSNINKGTVLVKTADLTKGISKSEYYRLNI